VSFGRQFLSAGSVDELVALERSTGRAAAFEAVDELVGRLAMRVFAGERFVSIERDERYLSTVRIEDLGESERDVLDETFSVAKINSRGSWNVPETVRVATYGLDLPWAYRQAGRFPNSVAMQFEWPKLALTRTAEAVLLWGVLAPLATEVVAPLRLRGPENGTLERDEFGEAWGDAERAFEDLGLRLDEPLSALAWASGYGDLQAGEMLERRRRLLAAIAEQASPELATRYRIRRLRRVIERYYAKARPNGTALRRTALTKELDQVLTVTFAGSWLAFLEYIGEQPHPKEQIVTAEHTPRLHVGGSERAAELAAKLNVPVEEVARIADLQWERTGGVSPVEMRVEALKRYWNAFDDVHARQRSGDRPLWGFLYESLSIEMRDLDDEVRSPGLYRKLLPAAVIDEVERLWGTEVLSRWPERLVTNPEPFEHVNAILNPALTFWHECALTAWYVCEGPWSRTDIPSMEQYYARKLAELNDLGFPVDRALFADLHAAERRLGPEQTIYADESEHDVGGMFSVRVSLSRGSRRSGFEHLRDVITRHRRAWAEAHLDTYLQTAWKRDLGAAEARFTRIHREKGKRPTLKQFLSSDVVVAANNWFGGHLADVYTAIGETAALEQLHERRMPKDLLGFMRTLHARLHRSAAHRTYLVRAFEGADRERVKSTWEDRVRWFAEAGPRYIQLEEALGRPPDLKEFGADQLDYRFDALAATPEAAWQMFEQELTASLRPPTAPVARGDTAVRPAEPQGPSTLSMEPAPPEERRNNEDAGDNPPPEDAAPKKRSWTDRLFRRP
jgi:hypothetical protein